MRGMGLATGNRDVTINIIIEIPQKLRDSCFYMHVVWAQLVRIYIHKEDVIRRKGHLTFSTSTINL